MPRDGSGVYQAPPGTRASPDTTIASTPYNALIDDLVQDANAARPLPAGGTGATTAVDAADAFSTRGANMPSAATTDIGAATGRYVQITGAMTITSFGMKTAGVIRIVTFSAALTLVHNAVSLILPGGVDILTAAGDVAIMVCEGGGNWRCLSYQQASVPARPTQAFARYDAAQPLTNAQKAQGMANLGVPLTLYYESAQQTITAGGLITLNHGLGVLPKFVVLELVCIATGDGDYLIGDRVFINPSFNTIASASRGAAIIPSASNIAIRFGDNSQTFEVVRKGNGANLILNNVRWQLVVRAWA